MIFLSRKQDYVAKSGVANVLIAFASLNSASWEHCGEQLPFFLTSVLS